MPLSAKIVSTGAVVFIFDYQHPKSVFRKGDIICKQCGEEMIIRHGLVKTPHFAHKTACTSDYLSHPESQEHLLAKEYVLRYLQDQHRDVLEHVDVEVAIEGRKRIADVMITFKTGWKEAHEIQLASITTEDLQKRTQDYMASEIEVYWWIGKAADTETNREWLLQNVFGFGTVEFKDGVEQLRRKSSFELRDRAI